MILIQKKMNYGQILVKQPVKLHTGLGDATAEQRDRPIGELEVSVSADPQPSTSTGPGRKRQHRPTPEYLQQFESISNKHTKCEAST